MPSSEQTVTDRIINPMRMLYRQPFKMEDEPGALSQYARALRHYEVQDLEAGWERLIRSYKGKSWPSLGEINAAIQAAEDERRKADPSVQVGPRPEGARRHEFADRVMRTAMGRKACEEGWNLGLWVFVFDQERLPEHFDIIAMRQAREEFDRMMDRLSRAETSLDRALFEAAIKMVGKRDRMARHYWPELVAA